MNPQVQALIAAILSNHGGNPFGSSNLTGADNVNQGTGVSSSGPSSSSPIINALGGLNPLAMFSPVNVNPNYGDTIRRHFNQNPLAGPEGFTGVGPNSPLNQPARPGTGGFNRQPSNVGHSSQLPTDFQSQMAAWR